MTGMRFCAGIFFSGEIETEIFSALLTEFKKVLIQNPTTDLTITSLHSHLKNQEFKESRVHGFKSFYNPYHLNP